MRKDQTWLVVLIQTMYARKNFKKPSIYFSSSGILRWARDYLRNKVSGGQWIDRDTTPQFHERSHPAKLWLSHLLIMRTLLDTGDDGKQGLLSTSSILSFPHHTTRHGIFPKHVLGLEFNKGHYSFKLDAKDSYLLNGYTSGNWSTCNAMYNIKSSFNNSVNWML